MANGQDPDPWYWMEKLKGLYEAFQAAVQAEDWEAAQQALNDYRDVYEEAKRLLDKRQ